ncbi:radical SAM family heme chaperone HemW [Candidatus Acidulodesulfobacterium sp. H_13]|uniref:radical SAM family heme chaperone HemW n=1 Tax=Candidatus Acidulodesulfobacterium sp. H_13 TaxID=3395470 RepID=UPI003AF46DE3
MNIYIHIPFCKSKCNYCSFYSIPISRSEHNPAYFKYYFNLLIKEMKNMSQKFSLRDSPVNGIYFGGGTPSIMPADFFSGFLRHIENNFKIMDDAEITVEINPESGDFEKLSALKSFGVNRLSIGAQSFNPDVLRTAGRIHNKEDIYDTVSNAKKAGFKNISLDLIIGLPMQIENVFHNDIGQILNMEPEHISAYMLSVENNTEFYKIYNKNNGITFASEERIAGYYEILCEFLDKADYIHYEISNFSKPGYESRHNMNYWKRGEYLGLGPSASSFFKTGDREEIRKTNVSDLSIYTLNILDKSKNGTGTDFTEVLTEKDKINEEIFLSLRTNCGISSKRLIEFVKPDIINDFINAGLMQIKKCRLNDYIVLTVEGMLLSSEIFARIMV